MTTASAQLPAHGIETVRIIAAHDGGFAQIAHLSWAPPTNPGDASLYIRPYVGEGWTAYGSVTPAVAPDQSVNVEAERHRDAKFGELKMSLHGSGQTHVYIGPRTKNNRLPAVTGRPLHDPSGGHIASITCFDLSGLPLVQAPSTQAPDLDLVVPAPGEGGTSKLNVALFSGTDEEAMRAKHPWLTTGPLLRFDRTGLPTPVFFGLRCGYFPGPRTSTPGVTVIGGWGPGAQPSDPVPMVSIWAAPDPEQDPV
ncbi:hypothetical protein [Streptomyces sp. NRRL F-5193]|uniref:hypothetical protein n=1 Tax=Streptomyces sp. NRRL F-5193 TaxID=1463860 RepID=UPI0005BD8EA3|nr:hypothetical protein [Streptomyces sp. NRRL F-5193]